MDKSICLHGIYAKSDLYISSITMKILQAILEDNAILSARMQDNKSTKGYHGNSLYNGVDYISLCDYEKKKISPSYNSYENYIRYSLSIMFPKDKLDIIEPTIIAEPQSYETMVKYGMSQDLRYSDLADEVQVKDCISLDLMNGITLPLSKMHSLFLNEKYTIQMVLKEIEKINMLLTRYNHEVPLYDIDTFELLDSPANVKQLVKHYYKKNRG